ncbi:MAG: hypothetical protein AYK19_01020 [Theionarchaea archaeon DG-70-1]|nr:MAG: hypothetical protein AYK19_01020 [Theionarchaea archaeon DG-70-1]
MLCFKHYLGCIYEMKASCRYVEKLYSHLNLSQKTYNCSSAYTPLTNKNAFPRFKTDHQEMGVLLWMQMVIS